MERYGAALQALARRITHATTLDELTQCEVEAFELWTSEQAGDTTPDANTLRIYIALRRAELTGKMPMIRPGDPLVAALDARMEGHKAWGDSVEGFAEPIYANRPRPNEARSYQYRLPLDHPNKKPAS